MLEPKLPAYELMKQINEVSGAYCDVQADLYYKLYKENPNPCLDSIYADIEEGCFNTERGILNRFQELIYNDLEH